ncbi:MAG: hypothetical protein OXI87_19300 [Albidovulum sp.]|nr:hypothetical protein [Albidovulum sp.]
MAEYHGIAPLLQNEFKGRMGIARAEINPPEKMFVRTWGCATHDIADGLHAPLYATCLSISPFEGGGPVFLLTLDLMIWMSREDEDGIRLPLEAEFGIAPGELLLHLSHSHGAPFTDPARASEPGGRLIAPYREKLLAACRRVMAESRSKMELATLSWASGRCGLAYDRDLLLPETGEIVCGLNPDREVDDTLVVGRVADAAGRTIATLVNYAAHPTSLGGGNRLVSPDYIGAMRELVERETDGAICVFLHGADGELTPRRSFEDDVEAADQNGRELGYAALSVLAGMFPPGHRMVFDRREESGATLGRWLREPFEPDGSFGVRRSEVRLELADLPTVAECREAIATAPDGFQRERAERRLAIREKLGEGDSYDLPIYAWRLGRSVLVGAPVEFYSDVQIALRRRFPDITVAVLDVCNGFLNYLPRESDYDRGTYPVRIALFARGSMERARDRATETIASLF